MATVDQIADLIAYVGGRPTVDDAFAGSKYDEARALVDAYIGDESVPTAISGPAVLEVAAKLWARRGAANGTVQYDTMDASPMPTPRDPMVTVYPVLARFLSGGFA